MTRLDLARGRGVAVAPTSQRTVVRRLLRGLLGYAALVVFAWASIMPFIWALSSSLKSDGETFLIPPTLIPRDPQWQNYL